MWKWVAAVALVVSSAVPAAAQVAVTADRIYLGSHPCLVRSGTGTPTGGASCDVYLDYGSGNVWVNLSGTWVNASTRTPTFTSVTTPTLTATGDLTISPVGDVILSPTGRDVLPGANYYTNVGSYLKRYLTLYAGELHVDTLVAQDVISTIGGEIFVAPTTQLTADLAAAGTTITVKHNQLANGDRVFMSANGNVEWMAITSSAGGSAGAYTYSVTRNLDGSGANDWLSGDALMNTGTTGDGYLALYAGNGVNYGPNLVGFVRTSSTYNAVSPRFAVGNLNGVGYGHATDLYGLAAGNASGAYIYLDDTNGLVMAGPGGAHVQITPAGAATFNGDGNGVTNINGGNIQTGSVTASKILVGGVGSALNDDPNTQDVSLWSPSTNISNPTVTDGKVGNKTMRSATAVYVQPVELRRIPVDPAKTYRVHFWARSAGSADGVLYAGVSAFDTNGTECDATTCPTGGARFLYCATGVSAASITSWTEYDCAFGAGTGATFPSAVRTMSPQALLNYPSATAGYFEIQDFRIEEMTPATLIKDGAITTDKITANAVTAAKIAANTITASQIASDTITATQIAANAITTSELSADSVTTDKIVAGTIQTSDIGANSITTTLLDANAVTAAKIASHTITASEIAASTITATEIAAGTITADKLNVSTLSAITANLGTVTAGSISGVTMTAGGGAVVIDSGGVSITNGTGNANKVKWDDGSEINSHSDIMDITALNGVSIITGGSATSSVSGNFSVGNGLVLGGSSPSITVTNWSGGGAQFLCLDNSGAFYRSGSACAAPSTSEVATLRAYIEQLEARIAALEAAAARRDR